jgi:hypothetical protein
VVSVDSSVEVRPEYFLSDSLEIAQNIDVTSRFDIGERSLGHSIDTGSSRNPVKHLGYTMRL